LSTLRNSYVEHLQEYRGVGAGEGEERAPWIRFFGEVTILASEQAVRLSGELEEIRAEWEERLTAARQRKGAQRALRSDSATALLLADLAGTPVLTAATVQRIHGVSRIAAQRAIEELTAAEILTARSIGPGHQAHIAGDVLELITWAERRLASTKFDTQSSPPHRGVPGPPEYP